MNKGKIVLGVILLIIGLVGVASMLTMETPLPPETEAILKSSFTDTQIKLLTLVNPTILLVAGVILGISFYQKVNLKVPIIEKFTGAENNSLNISAILENGIFGGMLAGILISVTTYIFNPILPLAFQELSESLQPSIAVRLLYGGFTEEIIIRFGLMTFIVWLFSKILGGLKPAIYWIGIIFAAIVFALGHFPIAYQTLRNPPATLLIFILVGNSLGGFIYGLLYWKNGLECAFIAHVFTHITLLFADPFIN